MQGRYLPQHANVGEWQERETEDRYEYQSRFEVGADFAAPLCGLCGADEMLHMLETHDPEEAVTELAAFADHLAHPQRRQPRVLRGSPQHALYETRNHRRNFCAVHDRRPDGGNDAPKPLFHDDIQQMLAVCEIVVNHGGRDSASGGDIGHAGTGDSLIGEQGNGGVQEQCTRVEPSG
jgi:hypothetical protein